MSGAPGSGKSTMSRLLGNSLGAVVIDHDVLRSPLLEFNVPFDQAAKHAYQLQWALAQDLLKQGHGVIIDSPCNFPEVLERGSSLASQYGYTYWYVECSIQDIDLLDRRLRTRNSTASQRTGIAWPPAGARSTHTNQDAGPLFEKWMKHPCRPKNNAVIVDATSSPEVLLGSILKQITS